MDDDRGEQQPLTQARLPRHQQRTAPPLHRVDRPQAEGEVAQMSGDKEKQNEAASQADAPYNQPREQHLRQRPSRRRLRLAIETFTSSGLQRVFAQPTRRRVGPNHVRTTILPPALFSSMQRCASTISSSLNTLPTWTRNVPAATCSTNSSSGVSMKSSCQPS